MHSIDTDILNHKDFKVAAEILAVQHRAYEQEAALLRVDRFPPLDRVVTDIQTSTDTFFGANIDGVLVGVASLETAVDMATACISSLTVAPDFQRRGIASALLSMLLKAARTSPVVVSTGARNEPALVLYQQFGFGVVKTRRLDEFDLELVELRRDPVHRGTEP